MFPAELCSELANLHANAPAHNWAFTKETVTEALSLEGFDCCGDGPEGEEGEACFFRIFQEFDEEPVASGSIAQVHRAVIRPSPSSSDQTPMKVAVKVRHPNVAELIDRDFRIMRKLAWWVDVVSGGWLSVSAR